MTTSPPRVSLPALALALVLASIAGIGQAQDVKTIKSRTAGGEPVLRIETTLAQPPDELITFKVKLNDSFSKQLQSEDERLQEVIQLQRLPTGGTRVVSSMIGWGSGADWDKTFEFFARGNEWSYRKLAKCAADSK